eukprot:295443-Lingulodinium_polyedra.AAC.1
MPCNADSQQQCHSMPMLMPMRVSVNQNGVNTRAAEKCARKSDDASSTANITCERESVDVKA